MRTSADIIPLNTTARRFVMLTAPHCGSSCLMNCLEASPELAVHANLFAPYSQHDSAHVDGQDGRSFAASRHFHDLVRPLSVFRFLDEFNDRRRAPGFRIMYSELRSYPEIIAWLALRRVAIVHLCRQNHLDVLISTALRDANSLRRACRVCLDPACLLQQIQYLEKNQRRVRTLLACLPNASIELSYERLCAEPKQQFDRLLDMLEINRALLAREPRFTKYRQYRRQDILENYPQVRSVLIANGYEALLEELSVASGAA